MIDLGTLLLKIQADTASAEKKLDKFGVKATSQQKAVSKVAKASTKAFAATSAAAIAACAGIKKLADGVASVGDNIDKSSQKMNVTAEEYQTLELAADHCGISMGTMSSLTTKAMKAGYSSVYDFIEELDKMPDSADKAALAQEVFGTKGANALAPYINGTATLADYNAELEKTGYLSDEAVANSAAYEDSMTTLSQSMMIVKNAIAEHLLPTITSLVQQVTDFITNHKEKLNELFTKVANGISYIVEHIKLIAGVIAGLGIIAFIATLISWIMNIVTAFKAVNVALMALSANPVVLIAAAVAALILVIIALVKNWDKVKAKIKEVWETVKNNAVVKSALDKISSTVDKVKNAFGLVKDKVDKFKSAIGNIKSNALERIKDLLDSIKSAAANISPSKWLQKLFGIKDGTDGSHRVGAREIPFDGYRAILHKGETVLTAAETNQLNKRLNSGGSAQQSTVINFNGSYSFMDREQINYFMKQTEKLMNRKVGLA